MYLEAGWALAMAVAWSPLLQFHHHLLPVTDSALSAESAEDSALPVAASLATGAALPGEASPAQSAEDSALPASGSPEEAVVAAEAVALPDEALPAEAVKEEEFHPLQPAATVTAAVAELSVQESPELGKYKEDTSSA